MDGAGNVTLTDLNISSSQFGVRVGGVASNVSFVGVNVTGRGQHGFYLLEGSVLRNVTVAISWFVDCGSDGIRRGLL